MKNDVTAALILIGNELLSGRTQDANLKYIAERAGAHGIRLAEVRVIPDDELKIVDAVNTLRREHDYVFTTGGIGPTHDDITSECVAKAFDVPLVPHPRAWQVMSEYFEKHGIEFNAARQRMAHAPEGAELVETDNSIAPGYRMQNVVVMAGVPSIMRAMLDRIVPQLNGGDVIHTLSVHTNLPEGTIATPLAAIQSEHQNMDIGSYPQSAGRGFYVILILRGVDTDELERVAQQVEAAIDGLGGKHSREGRPDE